MNDTMFQDENKNEKGWESENPYRAQNQEQNGNGKKQSGIGLGVASMILGMVSLLCFCTGLNIVTGITAIVFGIIQIVTCEKKGMAIAGITTAAISIVLCIGCYALIFNNSHFVRMLENEILEKELMEEFYDDDIRHFIEYYQEDDGYLNDNDEMRQNTL